MANALKLET